MRVVGPTWGWMEAALRSIADLARPDYAAGIKTPMLLFGAGLDKICRTPATRNFANRLPSAKYVELPDSKHEILMERDSIRKEFWKECDAFMASADII
jgi:lysophospholipase